jgi:hypothetical protein
MMQPTIMMPLRCNSAFFAYAVVKRYGWDISELDHHIQLSHPQMRAPPRRFAAPARGPGLQSIVDLGLHFCAGRASRWARRHRAGPARVAGKR